MSTTEIDIELNAKRAEVVAHRLAALGEPTRLQLVLELRERGSATVQELSEAVGASLPNVSKHLRHLRQLGLVTRHKDGTFAHYELTSEHVARLAHYAVRILGSLRHGR